VSPRGDGLRRDARGAVYVEFLIAFLPLYVFFSALVQLTVLQTADIVTKHAATTAARAAVVVLPDDPKYYSGTELNHAEGQRMSDIQLAATIPLTAIDSDPKVQVTFPSSATGTDNRTVFGTHDTIYVRVAYTYPCSIPIGNVLACGPSSTKQLVGVAAMPNQGANFEYP
jgi:Flp pilus assembly protein TadG